MSGNDRAGPIRIRRGWVAIGAIAFLVSVTLVGIFGENDFWRVALPGYVTGAGTLALAVVAYLTMVQEAQDRRALQQDAQRERERAERAEARERHQLEVAEQRRQAEGVQVRPAQSLGGTNTSFQFGVSIANRNRDSIYDLAVYFATVPREALSTVPSVRPLPSRLTGDETYQAMVEFKVHDGYMRSGFTGEAWVLFTDAHGRRWVRDPYDRLAQTTADYIDAMDAAQADHFKKVPPLPLLDEQPQRRHGRGTEDPGET